MKSILFLICIILISSCIHLNPRIKVDKTFYGLDNQAFVEPSFTLDNLESKYTLIIHGIGSQETDYSYEMMRSIAKYSGVKTEIKRTPIETEHKCAQIEKTEYFNKSGDKRLVFYTIRWSDLTEPAKKRLNITNII